MRCSGCGTENPAAAKFCSQCGAALAAACAQCGNLNPRTSRFCTECGGPLAAPALEPYFATPQAYTPQPLAEKILSDRSALRGEHKQVTALFADVAGFTSLAERLTPEESYTLMRRCFDLMLEEVHRYEGTVTQFLGDGILALFGAPIAHEDHAHRAAYAALGIQHALSDYQQELRESRGILFRMRVGLNSGLVVVGTIDTDLHMTYTAIGDTVNLASRVQELAEPGTAVMSEDTHRLVRGYFVTRSLGHHRVRGREQAVEIHEVLRPRRWRSRVEVSGERGLTPLVGRQQELVTLLDRTAAARTGSGQVVTVHGEAGIGKSRLLYECRLRLEGDALTWLEGRCISFGREIAYSPLIDLLKNCLEIEESDAEGEMVRKVEEEVKALGARVAASQPFLKHLLALEPGEASVATMGPQMRKDRIFEALRNLLVAAAGMRPLVVTVEDLHWIDSLSEEFLLSFAETVPQHPILLVLTARRGYEFRFATPAPSALTHLDLPTLSEPESAEVAQGLLGSEGLPVELQELIYRKAEGNPFFVEEVTKSLLEVGALRRNGSGYVLAQRLEEITIPGTIQDVIMARLDRLPEEPKRAIQTASVIGREFTVRLLERTAELHERLGENLQELKAVELIYERALYPELAYMFKHALTHDVAYNSLLLSRRKVLHRLVGIGIEELYSDRLAEQYETLAYHHERGEDWDKALDFLHRSADKALAAFSPQQAAGFYERALAAGEKSGGALSEERAIALHFGRGQALFLAGNFPRSVDAFQGMLQAAERAGDQRQESWALSQLSLIYFMAHRFEDALDSAERARSLAVSTHNDAALAASECATTLVWAASGDLTKASRAAEEARRAGRQAGIPDLLGQALCYSGLLDHWRGDETRALEHWDEALRIGRQHQLGFVLMEAWLMTGFAHCGRGAYQQALEALREGLELSTRLGGKPYHSRILNTLGWVCMDLCQWELAIEYNTLGATEARVVGDPEIIRNAELNLAECYLALGRFDESQRTLESVHQECQRPTAWGEEWMKWRYTQRMNASLGELSLARGDAEKALAFADACLAAAEATDSPRNIVKGRRLKGAALLVQGKVEEAEAELQEALRVARELGNPAQFWKTLAALGRLRQAQGRPHDALAAYQEALAVVEGVAAALSEADLRETLLASPQAAALRAAARAVAPVPQ